MDLKGFMDNMKKSSLLGNNLKYGKEFDDVEVLTSKGLSFPKCIVVRRGCIIDNLTFVYSDFVAEHGGVGGAKQEFALQENEHIVKVEGTYNQFSGQSLIENLKFSTDKGRVFDVGHPRKGANYFEFQAENGQAICGMFGRSDRYLANVGFYTSKINPDLGKGFPEMPGMKKPF